MSTENPNFNNENEKSIKSFEDIRTYAKNLPSDPEVLQTLTQEVKELIDNRGVKPELEAYMQALLYDVEMANTASANLSRDQKYFLEQVNGMLEEYIDVLEQQ